MEQNLIIRSAAEAVPTVRQVVSNGQTDRNWMSFYLAEGRAPRWRSPRPKQNYLRRNVSAAYHGLFHVSATVLADEYVGAGLRDTTAYALVYQSLDHRLLKDVCTEIVRKTSLSPSVPCIPGAGSDAVRRFAAAVLNLQEWHLRTYDTPKPRMHVSVVKVMTAMARTVVYALSVADPRDRRAFAALLHARLRLGGGVRMLDDQSRSIQDKWPPFPAPVSRNTARPPASPRRT